MTPLSGVAAGVLLAAGLIMCSLSVIALRMVIAGWHHRIHHASLQRAGHVVWRLLDSLAVALWSCIYILGGVAILAGLYELIG